MRKALVKSFMCDHYSKTMHWTATDRDPARYGIRGRSEYWLHRPAPTFQHRERAFFLLVAEKERIEWDQTIAPPPSTNLIFVRRETTPRQRKSEVSCSKKSRIQGSFLDQSSSGRVKAFSGRRS